MKELSAEDLERIAEQLIETGNLIRQHGKDALRVTEGWKPGAKTANLDPDRGGDRYETVLMPNSIGKQIRFMVKVPANDPTGEAVVAERDVPSDVMNDELVSLLNSVNLDAYNLRVIVKAAVPQGTRVHKVTAETGADVAVAGWCRSCHRDNRYCEPVATRKDGSKRYRDYCNWCGEWAAAHKGQEPPLELVKAKHEGRHITQRMVEQATRKKAS